MSRSKTVKLLRVLVMMDKSLVPPDDLLRLGAGWCYDDLGVVARHDESVLGWCSTLG